MGGRIFLRIQADCGAIRVDSGEVGVIRVLFDGYWWTSGPPSGRNVLISLVRAWAQEFPGDQIAVARPYADAPAVGADGVPDGVRQVRLRLPQHAAATLVELDRRGAGAELIVSQNFTPLRSRAVRAVFVHDAMFQERPEWFGAKERAYLSMIPRAARRAEVIATSSQAERRRIGRLNPALADRTIATGLALSESFRSAESVRPAGAPAPGRFLLAVGRLNVRKNVERLIRALERDPVLSPEFPLIVVGAADGKADDSGTVDDAERRGVVVRTGFVPDAELKWLYEKCAAFVFPSLDEGFGLPVLEAASSGSRIVLSAIPAFQEFGPIGDFFDPEDERSIAAAVRAALAREAPIDAGWAGRYSWAAAARSIRDAAERARPQKEAGGRAAATPR